MTDTGINVVKALYDYEGTTEEELSFKQRDTFRIISTENQDWWYVAALEQQGKEGYVPSTFVRYLADYNEEEILEDIEEEQEEGDASEYDDDEEYGNEAYDDEYQDGESTQEELDAAPENDDMIEVIKQQKLDQLRRKSSIKQTKGVKLVEPDPLQDLKCFEALPKGFRASTLANTLQKGVGRLSKHLLPDFNTSGLAFKDLFLESKHKIRKRSVKSTIAFSIIDAKGIPQVESDIKVLGRRVRMSLFDKTNILSNIHSVDSIYNPEFAKTWKFSSKASLLFPKDDENTCFLRLNDVDIRLSLLFELCLVVELPPKDENSKKSIVEISSGWGLLPLFTADGGPIENKTYEIKLYGGTPFEKDIELGITPERKSFLNSIINTSKGPRLNLRVWKLSKSAMSQMDTLPDTIVQFLSAVPILSLYRQLLANNLFSDHKEQGLSVLNTHLEPALMLVPKLLASNDFLRLFVSLWEKKKRLMKSGDRRSFNKLKAAFTHVVYTLWPLLQVHGIPEYIPGNNEFAINRQLLIKNLQDKGPIEFINENRHGPMEVDELKFNYFACA